MITYEVEVTAFGPKSGSRELKTESLDQVAALIDAVPASGGVIFVAALTPGVDHGNFYLFRNESGLAHIMLHEHREHFAYDPQRHVSPETIAFRDARGKPFTVSAASTT